LFVDGHVATFEQKALLNRIQSRSSYEAMWCPLDRDLENKAMGNCANGAYNSRISARPRRLTVSIDGSAPSIRDRLVGLALLLCGSDEGRLDFPSQRSSDGPFWRVCISHRYR
jgi:hypothetical protein